MCVFFKLKYTGVPLRICTGVNRKWVEKVRGMMDAKQ